MKIKGILVGELVESERATLHTVCSSTFLEKSIEKNCWRLPTSGSFK